MSDVLDVKVAPSGNTYVVGNCRDYLDFGSSHFSFTPTTANKEHYFLAKLSPSGVLHWVFPFGPAPGTANIDLDEDENVYVVGSFQGNTFSVKGQSIQAAANQNLFYFKVASNSKLKWAKVAQGGGSIYVSSHSDTEILYDGFGGLYLSAIYSSGPIDFGNGVIAQPDSQYQTTFRTKIDTTGTAIWSKSITYVGYLHSGDMTVDEKGHLYTTLPAGYFQLDTFNFSGPLQVRIASLDPNGNVKWVSSTNGPNAKFNQDPLIGYDQEGSLVVAGLYDSTLAITGTSLTSSTFSDIYMMKLDTSGNFLWLKNHGSAPPYQPMRLAVDSNNIFLAGRINDYGQYSFPLVKPGKNDDLFIAAFDSAGNGKWGRATGSLGMDYATALDIMPNGAPIIGCFIGLGDSVGGISFPNMAGGTIVRVLDKHNTVKGTVFMDADQDGVFDAAENPRMNTMVGLVPSYYLGISDHDGRFELLCDTGNYAVEPFVIPKYFFKTSPTETASFTTYDQQDTLNHIGLGFIPNVNDLEAHIVSTSRFRPGFPAKIKWRVTNVGTTNLGGSATLNFDPILLYTGSTPTASSSGNGTVNWNLPSMVPAQYFDYETEFLVDSNATLWSSINFYLALNPTMNDTNPKNNNDSDDVVITGAYDPNDKTAYPNRDLLKNEVDQDFRLKYRVRFQNTGNDTAFTVVILDTLEPKLDITTLEMIAGSHNYVTEVLEGNIVRWTFPNILLPDSNVNEPGSHGYVVFRIAVDTSVQVGDSITNSVSIYFDFNKPVKTNYAVSHIVTFGGPPLLYIPLDNSGIMEDDSVLFQWSEVAGADSFHIQVSSDANFSSIIHSTTTKTKSFWSQSLVECQKYFWRVRGFDATQTTGWSDTFEFQLNAPSLSACTNPIPLHESQVIQTATVQLSWTTPNGSDAEVLTVSKDPALSNPIVVDTVTTSAYTLNNLDSNSTYYWSVTLMNCTDTLEGAPIWEFHTPDEVILSTPFEMGADLIVTPNPTTGIIKITGNLSVPGMIRIDVLDLRGKKMLSSSRNSAAALDEELDLSVLPVGTYLLKVKSANEEFTSRVILR